MSSEKSSKSVKIKRDSTGNVAYNMGHILYMTQLTGEIDRDMLISSMPEQDRERYSKAFEALVRDELLVAVKTDDKSVKFSVNSEKIEDIKELSHRFVRGIKEEIKVKQMPKNPFFHRGPIKNIEHFIGRDYLIPHIYDRLRHTEDCSIIGPRAIGKTSLLHYISHKEVIRRYQMDPSKYIFVYCDLQRFGENAKVNDFYYEMFSQTVSRINLHELITSEEINLINKENNGVITKINRSFFEIGDLDALIAALSERDYRLVYMFDEFESIANNPTFDFGFYGQLRALSGDPSYLVAFITASKNSIYDLTFSPEIKTSPFFRYFEDFKLGLMNVEEVRGFFRLAAKSGYIFSSRMRNLIEEWSGGHPFLVQLACDYFFDLALNQEKLRPGEEERHLKIFLKRHQKHFGYFWAQVDKREQACLWRLALGKTLDSDCIGVLEGLEDNYLVVKNNGNHRMFSKAFERFVKDSPSPKSKFR